MQSPPTHRIALYPGDGIGPEVIDQAVRVLNAVQSCHGGFRLEMKQFDWGADYWHRTGQVAPPDFLDRLRRFDAVLLGALGDPARLPDHITLHPLLRLRQEFDLYACVRPAKLLPGVRTPLASTSSLSVDLVVVRENSEGEYVDCGGRLRKGQPDELSLQTAIHTRPGITRILRFGFDLARRRRKHLTMITKSNALRHAFVLWDQIFEELRPEFPDVQTEKQHVDAAAMNLVRHPQRFDVLVASNLFGDILSDLTAMLAGGLGLAPSANLNPNRLFPSLFEPVHGSAPDIAGKGIANPTAAILSAAMMLEWLGSSSAAEVIRQGVERALASGAATADLGGALSTAQMTNCILEELQRNSS